MKKFVIGLVTFASASAFAELPSKIVCDSYGTFGLRSLTRVEFDRIGNVLFKMNVLREVSCGANSGCSRLKLVANKDVILFESPLIQYLLVTPYADISGDDIRINPVKETCRIKTDIVRLNGQMIDIKM